MRRRPFSSKVASVAVIVFWSWIDARAARADIDLIHPVTPRAMGMGGAYSAVSDDPSALYYNPAGLVRVEGSYTGLAFLLSFPSLTGTRRSTDPDTGRAVVQSVDGPPRDQSYGLQLAWRPKTFLDGNFGAGFSIMLPHQRALHFNVHKFEDPYYVLYENSIELLQIRLGAAYKFFDLVSVGASVLLLAGLDGTVRLKAPFQSRERLDPEDRTVLAVDAVLPNRQFFTAGAQFYPIKGLTFGISYREPTFVQIALPIDFAVIIVGLQPPPTVATLDVKVKYSPAQLTFGAAYQVLSNLLVSLDLVYGWYSNYEIPYGNVCLEQVQPGRPKVLRHSCAKSETPEDKDNPIVLLPPKQPNIPLRNLLIPRIGAEWKPMDALALRAGYYFLPTFIQSSDAPILDSDKHSFTLGASYGLGTLFLPVGDELNLTAAVQMVVYVPRTIAEYTFSGQLFSTTFGAEFKY